MASGDDGYDVIVVGCGIAGPTLRWLTGFGVEFDFLPNYFITESTTRMAPAGGGLALVEALAAHAETVPDRIAIHYETTARRLILDDTGRVNGVEATGANNRTARLPARAVVLASGGFEGNPEMLSRYLGPQSQFIRPVARGGYYNRGEGIRIALEIGAAPCGDYGSFHAQPVDPRSGQHEPVVLNYPYGILVNREGRRFVDEAPATVDASYEAASRKMMAQTEGIAFAIADARLDDVPNWQKSVRTDQPAVEAETPAALAQALGIDGEGLARTLDAYNAACRAEDGFTPLALDGLSTDGLVPRKSNWARPVDRLPYRAWPIVAANCFTFGGLKIDPLARVLNTDGETIPGLYAAGETAGHYDPSFPIALCLKDLDLIAELMRETGVRNDLIEATHARFREAGARYGTDAGDMTVCKLLEDEAGVELRVTGDWVASWEMSHPEADS